MAGKKWIDQGVLYFDRNDAERCQEFPEPSRSFQNLPQVSRTFHNRSGTFHKLSGRFHKLSGNFLETSGKFVEGCGKLWKLLEGSGMSAAVPDTASYVRGRSESNESETMLAGSRPSTSNS